MKNATATRAELKEMVLLQNAAVNFNLSERDSCIALNGANTAAQHALVDVPLLALAMPRALEAAKSAGFHGRRAMPRPWRCLKPPAQLPVSRMRLPPTPTIYWQSCPLPT
ncbi:MAG: hypothetical protein ACR5LG_02425 [Sodalis sp. (in: enterobacteria)]|uniref:hypothetical protein n=1 Tax=Sodalis sp. (in: enterobacteria) TaxID=1898979 RepID=UPI003F38897F